MNMNDEHLEKSLYVDSIIQTFKILFRENGRGRRRRDGS